MHTNNQPLTFWSTIDENVKKVPRRLVGCRGDGIFDPSGVVGELGTVYMSVYLIELFMPTICIEKSTVQCHICISQGAQ